VEILDDQTEWSREARAEKHLRDGVVGAAAAFRGIEIAECVGRWQRT
jgi:hypothetical protein